MKKQSFLLLALFPLIISACGGGSSSASESSKESSSASSEQASSESSSASSTSETSSEETSSIEASSEYSYDFIEPTEEEIAHNIEVNGNYRNMYQIFPIAFADSDGNGRGDLQGIIDKIDYLKEMNYTGIWLNPIHPSSTYHHYDVEDYKAIGSDLGTMEMFDNLVAKCHENDMTIILDLVINHSSNKHDWFVDSYTAAKAKRTRDPLYKLYNWIDVSSGTVPAGYHKVNNSDKIAYESVFDASMPDLNLQQVLDEPETGDLATKLRDIFSFWLIDHDIDGFRLDAVTHYFENDQAKNLEFMTWLNNEIRAIKPEAYVVGEGSWNTNSTENKAYQASGLDSFFQFGNCAKNNGYITQAVNQQNAKVFSNGLINNRNNADGGIEAPFLGNHDVPRYIGSVSGRTNLANAKFAMGLLQTMAGATFTYYGDEIGMASQSSIVDSFYRLPMDWGDQYTPKISKIKYYAMTEKDIDSAMSYPYENVINQLDDNNSLLNYVKHANLLRIKYPALARGDSELIENPSKEYVLLKRTYQDETIYVFVNASNSNSYDLDYESFANNVDDALLAQGNLGYINDHATKIPPQSIVILK